MNLINLEFKLLKKLSLLPYFRFFKNIKYGQKIVRVPIINNLGYANLFLKPNWLNQIINEIYTVDQGAFIDVGANIGQTLIAVKASKHKIYYLGFEPNISCCYYLKELINQNNFSDCHVYNFALSDKLKEDFLETNYEADSTGSLIKNLRPGFFTNRESIFSLNYDSLNINQKITFVKIDVEGGELEAIVGMQNMIDQHRPYIVCEILDSFDENVLNFTQKRADEVCKTLDEHNYAIIQIIQSKEHSRIVSFNKLDKVTVKQWTNDSYALNDYIFFPVEKENIIKDILTKVCS